MTQIISKDKEVKCITTVPYPPEIIRDMKKAGFKIKEVPDEQVKDGINVSNK